MLDTWLGYTLFYLLLMIPGFRKDFEKRTKDEMVRALAKVVEVRTPCCDPCM